MPYSNLPDHAFWRLCRDSPDFRMADLFQPKFDLVAGEHVAAAGSCFAQHIGRYLRQSQLSFVDVEPAPKGMPRSIATQFGYSLYSARYGNVYTPRQMLQLLRDAESGAVHDPAIWSRDGRVFDALRPSAEPEGLLSADALRAHRRSHLLRVREMVREMDVFVFTLGLTEAWRDRETGIVFPSAPGVIAGEFDPKRHEFVKFSVLDVIEDLATLLAELRAINTSLRVILTVSPVPLTATASGRHVLQATTLSKSVLRAAVGELVETDPLTDYFPSFEIITGAPYSGRFFASNLRTVTDEGVAAVMATFFGAYPGLGDVQAPEVQADDALVSDGEDDLICEDALLEAFAKS